jgi:hypothetical protein
VGDRLRAVARGRGWWGRGGQGRRRRQDDEHHDVVEHLDLHVVEHHHDHTTSREHDVIRLDVEHLVVHHVLVLDDELHHLTADHEADDAVHVARARSQARATSSSRSSEK